MTTDEANSDRVPAPLQRETRNDKNKSRKKILKLFFIYKAIQTNEDLNVNGTHQERSMNYSKK